MTTPTGQISLSQVNDELDVSPTSTQINMGSAPVRGLAEVPTGAISMSDLQGKSNAQFVVASGGSTATQGNFKIHTFNSGGTFTVNQAGNAAGSNQVEYMVVAGGGGGGDQSGPGRNGAAGHHVSESNISLTSHVGGEMKVAVGGGGAGGAGGGRQCRLDDKQHIAVDVLVRQECS